MKRKPTGFVAICQCGKAVGALDGARTDQKDAGKLLGKWLSDGCTVQPMFDGTWVAEIKPCACASVKGGATCAHPDEVEQQLGDGTPVYFCPDCGHNRIEHTYTLEAP